MRHDAIKGQLQPLLLICQIDSESMRAREAGLVAQRPPKPDHGQTDAMGAVAVLFELRGKAEGCRLSYPWIRLCWPMVRRLLGFFGMTFARLALFVAAGFFAANSAHAGSGYGEEAEYSNTSDGSVECNFISNQSCHSLLVKKLSFRWFCPTCDIQIGGVDATAMFSPEIGSDRLEFPVTAGFVKDQGSPFPIAGAATNAEGIISKGGAPIRLAVKALDGSGIRLSACRAWVTGTLGK